MNSIPMFVAALIVIPALGLATWAWFRAARVGRELHSLDGFEGMHFEIGPQASQDSKGARWPIPG